MNEIKKKDDLINSEQALYDYIRYKKNNSSRHRAIVQISSNGTNLYCGIIYVCINIEKSLIILEGDNKFVRDFYNNYSTRKQRFEFAGKTLLVHASDRWSNKIEINITKI